MAKRLTLEAKLLLVQNNKLKPTLVNGKPLVSLCLPSNEYLSFRKNRKSFINDFPFLLKTFDRSLKTKSFKVLDDDFEDNSYTTSTHADWKFNSMFVEPSTYELLMRVKNKTGLSRASVVRALFKSWLRTQK